ncbi:MAG: MarR family transcriptional regulator [Deltaproteobacteria bacterium]|nr:MarR family transcriptional regulator [Deltaproteobacteria bacterium]
MTPAYIGDLHNLVLALCHLVLKEAEHRRERTEPDSTVLLAVAAHPGLSVGEVASIVRLTHSGAVRVVDRLEAAALVRRTKATDARAVALALTKAGQRAVHRMHEAQGGALDRRLACLSPSEARTLRGLLARMLEGAAESREQARRLCLDCDHAICRDRGCPVGGHLEGET